MLKRLMVLISFLILISYIVFCGLVYFYPQLFFYNPSSKHPRIEVAQANSYPAQRIEYKSQDGTELFAWYTKPQANMPIVVFMHGNSHNIESFYHKLVPFVEAGYGTLLPEYRGFGGIKGKISQTNLGQDAIAGIKWLYSQGYQNNQIIIYGMSLGSYTSIYTTYTLGKEKSFKSLILEVPFDSMYADVKQIVKYPLPLKLIMRDKFDNTSMIKELHLPILIMGALDDTLVPVERAKSLYSHANNPKQIKVYLGAEHSELYKYRNYNDILEWLKANEEAGL